MKLMKHITIALFLCAIPAVAFGQTVTCDDCTHVVSVFQGNGGLIAEADAAEMVTYVTTCDGITQSDELEPNADGVVSMSFQDEGVACDADDGEFMIGPVMDGGWFWITGENNSAVGNLVDMDILMNANSVDATNAGESVTTTEGQGAVLLRHTSGRMGLLPTILPVPDVAAVRPNTCSYTTVGATHTRETSNCMLGDGGSALLVQGPTNIFTGTREHVAANGTVTRPAAGSLTVDADLWGNGSGHFTTVAGGNARLGHPKGTRLAAMIRAGLTTAGPGSGVAITSLPEVAGMTLDIGTPSLGVLTIGPDPAYCNPTAKPPLTHSATVTFTASVTELTQVTPTLVAAANGVAARHTIVVVCPTALANKGVELVPDNPFPTDK